VFVNGPAALRDCGWSPLNWRHDAHVSRNVGATVRSVCRNNFNRLTLSERSPDWLARMLSKYPFSVVTMLNLIISESPEFSARHLARKSKTKFNESCYSLKSEIYRTKYICRYFLKSKLKSLIKSEWYPHCTQNILFNILEMFLDRGLI